MIEFRRRGAFALGAERFAVPVRHNVDTVRVGRRDQEQDRVVEDLFGFAIVCCRKFIGEIHRNLRSDDLGRVDRA